MQNDKTHPANSTETRTPQPSEGCHIIDLTDTNGNVTPTEVLQDGATREQLLDYTERHTGKEFADIFRITATDRTPNFGRGPCPNGPGDELQAFPCPFRTEQQKPEH